MATKVLVTGCAGYIGSVLCQRLLEDDCEVHGIDRLMYKNANAMAEFINHPKFHFHHCDCQDRIVRKLARQADVLIPLAALVGAPVCEQYPHEARYVNACAVKKLVKIASRNQFIIYPNTNSGYGKTDGQSEVTEESSLNPISVYGRTKCDAERDVEGHYHHVIFRLATVFGDSPRMRYDLMLNDFVRQLVGVKSWRDLTSSVHGSIMSTMKIFEPNFHRNFVHVEDVAAAFKHAIHTRLSGIYNLGNPLANTTKLQLAHRICDLIGLTRDAVTIGNGKDPDQRDYIVSNQKVLDTGFKFVWGLDAGIHQVVWRLSQEVKHPEIETRNF